MSLFLWSDDAEISLKELRYTVTRQAQHMSFNDIHPYLVKNL